MNVENEGNAHKARIVGFSVLMAAIAAAYQGYYDDMASRSAQLQQQAVAGRLQMPDYIDPLSDDMWTMRNTLAVIKDKPMKELVYINKGWDSQVLNVNVTKEYPTFDINSKPVDKKLKQTLFSPNSFGPQGRPGQENNYYTQTERYAKYAEAKKAEYARRSTPQGRVDADAVLYDRWQRLHSLPTLWFDTAGCVSGHWSQDSKAFPPITTSSNFSGSVDKGTYKAPLTADQKKAAADAAAAAAKAKADADAAKAAADLKALQDRAKAAGVSVPQQVTLDNMKKDLDEAPTLYVLKADQKTLDDSYDPNGTVRTWWANPLEPRDVVKTMKDDGTQLRDSDLVGVETYPVDWATNIQWKGGINYNLAQNIDVMLMEGYISLIESCDVECQARGSGLTAVAQLNSISMGFICLNALFMFIGTWRYRWRVCSVYCTVIVACFQIAIVVFTAVCIFSPYSLNLCALSLTPTDGERGLWTMSDDWYTHVGLWASQLVLIFAFWACGWCQVWKAD